MDFALLASLLKIITSSPLAIKASESFFPIKPVAPVIIILCDILIL
jgi:hypothetical protein